MKEWKKNIKYIVLVIFLIAILPVSLWLVATNIDTASKDNAEKYFKKDKDDIILVTDYLVNSNSSSISINDTDIITIKDEKVKEAFNRLFKKKYSAIDKNNNAIEFTIWTRFNNFGSGIVYSINNEEEPTIEYLTKLVPLSEDGWYYYEADYNLWRDQQ